MWLYNKKLCYNTFRMNHTIKHANAENHSCTVVLKRLILKESLSFWAFRHICILLSCMHEKEGVEWKHQFDKKNCVQKHQFEITGLWQFKRLLRYNSPIRSTFKSSQNTAPRQFNFMCLDVVKWTAHLGKVEREENNFHNVYLGFGWLHFFQKWGVSRQV